MQSTFPNGLATAFKGKMATAGFLANVENGGSRTVGGFVSKDNAPGATTMKAVDGNDVAINTPIFGVPLFVKAANPYEFFVGNGGVAANVIAGDSANMVFRGFLLNRAMVNQQMAGHSDRVIALQPCDAVYQGAIWLYVQGSVAVGDSINVTAAGEIKAGTAATGAFQVPNAKIIEKHQGVEGLYLVMLS